MKFENDIDLQLWKEVRKEDYKAFERLFHKYYDPLCRYAEGFLGNPSQAEDAVQDMFLHFWEHRASIDINTSLSSCFYKAVHNRALRMLENDLRKRDHDERLQEYIREMSKSDSSQDESRIEEIRKAMEELPPQCLKVFAMNCLEGKKYNEIAEELSISINTIKFHIKKAYSDIRQKLNVDKRSLLFIFFLKNTHTKDRATYLMEKENRIRYGFRIFKPGIISNTDCI